jgi:hypothetical protein
MIQYSRALVMESKSRGVLDTRLRGYDANPWSGAVRHSTRRLARRLEPLFGEQPHRGVGVHRLAERKALRVFAPQLIELHSV